MEDERNNAIILQKVNEPVITVPNPRPVQVQKSVQTPVQNGPSLTKYSELLEILPDLGREIRQCYSGSRSATERVKRGINIARNLVKECIAETERTTRQN